MAHTLTTVKSIRCAIRTCTEVLITARLGLSEKQIKISKKEALYLIEDIADSEIKDMYTKSFGTYDNGTLYLG